MRVLALIALCLPFEAQALSCLPHAIEATFQEAEASEAAFVIVQGRLDFDAGALPQTDLANQHEPYNQRIGDPTRDSGQGTKRHKH